MEGYAKEGGLDLFIGAADGVPVYRFARGATGRSLAQFESSATRRALAPFESSLTYTAHAAVESSVANLGVGPFVNSTFFPFLVPLPTYFTLSSSPPFSTLPFTSLPPLSLSIFSFLHLSPSSPTSY